MDFVVPLLLAAIGVLSVLGWRVRGPVQPLISLAMILGLSGAAALLFLADDATPDTDSELSAGVALAGVLAIAGGGVVTSSVFALVDGSRSATAGSMKRAGDVLRGGAWIGGLERAAVFATLAADWPEGLAVTLALKGLGRYPELRTETPGAAERFIIGTFTSVLWAIACAGVASLMC